MNERASYLLHGARTQTADEYFASGLKSLGRLLQRPLIEEIIRGCWLEHLSGHARSESAFDCCRDTVGF